MGVFVTSWPGTGQSGGMWGWVSLGFGAASTPLSPRLSAGCSEAVYLLAPSADGHWLAAVSGDWAIHIYNLKCFKVGLGVTPQPQGTQHGGLSQHCPLGAIAASLEQGWVWCGKGRQRQSWGFWSGWVCEKGVRGSPGGSGQG